MLDATHLIRKPLITEKSTWESTRLIKKGKHAGDPVNRFSFEVVMTARKPQIKAAIEEIYGVRVQRVSTQIRKGRTYRTKFGTANTGDWKKATVQLHPDDKIELF